ncbi:DUF4064 domain-containing protein [Ornithinibacillus contaminans]|uniref:DUF4064 domain-containing protein n=1 Tax=Ornithinibacillus contaminans TaxID=694055 RepID=UPI00064DDC97|nr:DUF4064 domain-containing protein [Ornithinibacillus contaminans]
MKRTAEITLGIIGIVFYVFSILVGAVRLWMENNQDYLRDFLLDNQEDFLLTPEDIDLLFDVLATGGIIVVIMPIIAVILGIVAMVFLKGDNRPVAAGIILIATGVLYVIITGGGGILSGILFLIAGILCLTRKPNTIIEAP